MSEPQVTEVRLVSKISMKNAGRNPKAIHGLPKEQRYLRLCIIIGEASGIKQVDDPTHGTVHEALVGRFQSTDAETGDQVRSGMLYLPKGIHETITSAVKAAAEGELVRFALEMRAVRADNPAGYTYEAVPLLKPAEHDPLSEITQLIAQSKQARLEPPKQSTTEKAPAKK